MNSETMIGPFYDLGFDYRDLVEIVEGIPRAVGLTESAREILLEKADAELPREVKGIVRGLSDFVLSSKDLCRIANIAYSSRDLGKVKNIKVSIAEYFLRDDVYLNYKP